MRFCSRNFFGLSSRRHSPLTVVVAALLIASLATPAFAQGMRGAGRRKKGGDATPAATPAEAPEVVPAGMTMTKTQSIFALIQALAVNQSDAARETLEQIVLGKMKFGAHDKQAAESALAALAMRPNQDGAAFLLKLISEPDDKVRPGDTKYPAAEVRYDAVRIACRVGTPELRVSLAKAYDAASPEIRTAIETALSRPSPASFAAQVVLSRSRVAPDAFKITLRKLIFEQNANALKQALKISGDAPGAKTPGLPGTAPGTGLTGLIGGLYGRKGGGLPGTPPSGLPTLGKPPGPGPGAPSTPAAAAAALQNPVATVLDAKEKMIDAAPVNADVVARELWQNDFVESLAGQVSEDKTNQQIILNGIGSIPLKSARERLHDFLQHKGPQELGQLEKAGPPTMPAPGGTGAAPPGGMGGMGMGGRGMGGMGMGGRGMGGGRNRGVLPGSEGPANSAMGAPAATQGPAFVVGGEWLDPGTVVVLKTLSYKDRPKTRHHTPSPPSGGRRTPAGEKKAEEAAEKAKQLEAQYEWRDTVEKFVSHWDDRLSAIAEKREGADADTDSADAKKTDGKSDAKDKKDPAADKKASKSGKDSDTATKKSHASEKKETSDKSKGAATAVAPTPSVPVPFALMRGQRITKEFHIKWPEDLPANLSATVTEPLVVHYIELEVTDDVNHAATFYRGAFGKTTGSKTTGNAHDLPDGKWIDVLQRDLNGQKVRSLDVLVTRPPGEADAKKSKVEDLTVRILMVEVDSFEPEAKSEKGEKPSEKAEKADKKEQARRDG